MEDFITSGRVADLILVSVALEAIALLGWCGWHRGMPVAGALLSNLASGAALVLAVRAALTGANWTILASCLIAALLAHIVDLSCRLWPQRRGRLAALISARTSEHREGSQRSWHAADLE